MSDLILEGECVDGNIITVNSSDNSINGTYLKSEEIIKIYVWNVLDSN